jgi:hypothetical protein
LKLLQYSDGRSEETQCLLWFVVWW